jgi:cation diffusion facilitator family transporter
MNYEHLSLPDKNGHRYRATRKVTLIGAITNLFLSIAQIAGGLLTSSQAVLADGIHTLSDLASDFMVLFAARQASKEADEEHPYGHQRIETVATVALGTVLTIVGLSIGYRAIVRLLDTELLVQPEPMALVFAALAIISKEGLFHYTRRVARRIRSRMLEANAWHHRSDVVSSLVVLVGVVTSLMGFPLADALAALIIAAMIMYMGGQLVYESFMELIDTGLDPELVEEMRRTALEIDEVTSLHMLRTRSMGGYALADVHIQVDPRISVSEGHQISEAVRQRLINQYDELEDVMVHIDPEDDELGPISATLPLRSEFKNKLINYWKSHNAFSHIQNFDIHYLNGLVELDIYLPLELMHDSEQNEHLRRALNRTSEDFDFIGQVRLYYM